MHVKVLTWSLLLKVSMIVDELLPLEEVLFAGHTGVVVGLLQAAVSCPEKQASLLQELLRAFHTESAPRGCVPVFLSLTTSEVLYGGTEDAGKGGKRETKRTRKGHRKESGVRRWGFRLLLDQCINFVVSSKAIYQFLHEQDPAAAPAPSTCTAR